jgi:two-component system heavy metal sensor histidine kinase CusS
MSARPVARQQPFMHPRSLTWRLTLSFSLVAACVFAGFGWVIEQSIEHHFRVEDNDELAIIADTAGRVLARDQPMTLAQRLNDILVGHHAAILRITDPEGKLLFSSPGAPALDSDIGQHTQDTGSESYLWQDGEYHYRVMLRRFDTNGGRAGYTLRVAVAIDHHLRFLRNFRQTLWLMIATAIIITGLMAWFAVYQGHKPLRAIVARLKHTSASHLNTRLPPESVPRELADLVLAFNEMLERMENAFQRLANFSADIAHELRTPITNLMTQTQVALTRSRTIDEYREILYSNIEEYERIAQMVNDMLFLAQTDERQIQLHMRTIDLARELRELYEYFDAWVEERKVTLALTGQATINGDRAILRRALSNILANAIRYTPATGTVTTTIVKREDGWVTINIENPGPSVAAEHLPRLFDRFYRVDNARQRNGSGTGLGLAIVKSIITMHGGKISAFSTGEGMRFLIELPEHADQKEQ